MTRPDGKISEEELALLNLGFKLDSEGRTEEALQAFRTAADANVLCAPAAHFHRGLIYRERKDPVLAEREFRYVLDLVPYNSKASYFLQGLLLQTGRVEEAIEEGLRFFRGRTSTKSDQLISDYRDSLEHLLSCDVEQLEELRAAAFRAMAKGEGPYRCADEPDYRSPE